jgi:hypothetical protein
MPPFLNAGINGKFQPQRKMAAIQATNTAIFALHIGNFRKPQVCNLAHGELN